jgi:hypothetical protein
MELRDALAQITVIRSQLARSQTFRGYRASVVACSSLLAWAAALLQSVLVPAPLEQLPQYVAFWACAAGLSMVGAAAGIAHSLYTRPGAFAREQALRAVEQFSPCIVAGGLMTWALVRVAPECGWLLPGLWCIIFGLGVFASWRLLPAAIFWVGAWYIGGGLLLLATGKSAALAPWTMGLLFGGGQALTAGILYWKLERADGDATDNG